MFAKAFLIALLSLSFATTSLATPAENDIRAVGKNNNNNDAVCATAAKTVTVTAAAAAATSTNVAVSTGSKGNGNTGKGTGSTGNNASNGKGAAGNNDKGATTSAAAAAATTSAAAAASTSAAASSGNNAASAGGKTDPLQSSLTLDPTVVCTNFADTGNNPPTDGQVDSLTSTNNFINFCASSNQKLPLTNGLQVTGGSCNPAPMGQIPSVNNLVGAKFQSPRNLDVIKSNTAFTINYAIAHLQTGSFTNAAKTYYAAPQQINNAGDVIGHSHVVIEAQSSLQSTDLVTDNKFAFFKGVNGAAKNGILSVDVTDGLPAGIYKLTTINSAANHQPVLMPVAQHRSTEDAVFFAVTDDGKPPAEFAKILGGAGAAAAAAPAAAGNATAAAGAAKGGNNAAASSASALPLQPTRLPLVLARPLPRPRRRLELCCSCHSAAAGKAAGFKGGRPGKRRIF
ncbi:hypothetical protein BC629DRAFT_1496858 [Irpex lacteus]|nr:hypothetical protein BC629DRAFT_1496858 [Irpex lacteus]